MQTTFTKAHKGSGLGLSIAKSLTELHGGSLRIRSAPSVGTVVMVTLPIGAPPDAVTLPSSGSEVLKLATPMVQTVALLH